MYKRILVAMDDSEGSWQALLEAARLTADDARLRVMTVAGHPSWAVRREWSELYDEESLRRGLLADSRSLLDKVEREMRTGGVLVETCLADLTQQPGNSIPEAVLTEADIFRADLIVLGTHGRQGFRRLLLGSVAEHILRMANRPVLLVKEGMEVETEQLPEYLRDFSGRLFADWPQAEYLSG